jgi:mycothiol synthase
LSDAASELGRILAVAQAQHPDPAGWSLAVNVDWLEHSYFGTGVSRNLEALPTGELGGCASVRIDPEDRGAVTVTAMLRPGCEHLWAAQLTWIEAQVEDACATRVRVVSECLSDAETHRWVAAGYDLIFEELAMELDMTRVRTPPPARWPRGSTLVEWGNSAAEASFEVYEAAFRDRPGFPGWLRSEWIDALTGDDDFLPAASLCVLLDGMPAGFVVCLTGWIDQVGVAPAHRRLGLASALVTEAIARMGALGISVAHLHVNTNNPGALATWRRLGWRESGRRGRFERVLTSRAPAKT